MQPALSAATAPYPMPSATRFPNPLHNPEGWAAVGAMIGNLAGGISGALLSTGLLTEPSEVELIVSPATAEEAQQVAAKTAQELALQMASWRRRAYAISGTLATVGAAIGAYVGAAPHQKTRAAIGAAIGTGTARSLNVLFVPPIGIPGLLLGAAGAWVGARGARPAYPTWPSR